MLATEKVILVNENDEAIGEMEKLEAHQKGLLHRAFSVFIFNQKGQMLLQQRSQGKYHSPGLWTNTCCSHPFPGEKTLNAAKRRLMEEMGIEAELQYMDSLLYKTSAVTAGFENGLTEYEFDHIFTGKTNIDPVINKEEVESFAWLSLTDIKAAIKSSPNQYTHWFKLAIEKFF